MQRIMRAATFGVVGLAAMLVGGCAGTPSASVWRGPFVVMVLADPQFGMWEEDAGFARESASFEAAIAAANRLRPAFVVVCGDLINRPGDENQRRELLRIAGKLDPAIPIHWVAGNHDVTNEPGPDDLAWYRKSFGPDRYSFRHGGCTFLILNTTIIKSPEKVSEEEADQRTWLREELERAREEGSVQIVLFQHHPWFLTDPAEEDQYFNIPQERRTVYLDLLEEYGVSAVFAGHYHRNSFGRAGALQMVTSGPVGKPLGDDPSGFTLVAVHRHRIGHVYCELAPAPATSSP